MIPTSRTVVPIADRPGGGPAAVTEATFRVPPPARSPTSTPTSRDLRHPYLGDLTIELIHAGETVMLFNPPDGLGATDIDHVMFDSDSATPVFSAGAGPGDRHDAPAGRRRAQPLRRQARGRRLDAAHHGPVAGRRWRPARLGRYGAGFPCSRLEIPAASTGGADQQTTDSAVVSGAVTPNGRATGLRFAYGTTTAYGRGQRHAGRRGR